MNTLQSLVLEQFDKLVNQGELLYQPSTPELVSHNGFHFQFRMTPALSKKPMLSRTDPGRSKPQGGPFINPDPEFIVDHVGSEHTLLMNKYCVLRPMLVLHTNAYQPQSSDLDSTDLTAAWNVLNALTPQYMVIYNCGVDSGSSQGHKHMQVFPKEEGLELFPDRAVLAPGQICSLPKIPYKHFVAGLSPVTSVADLVQTHSKLLQKTRATLEEAGATDYNVVFTQSWMMMIPRRHAGRDGVCANAAGMVGMVWVKHQEERDAWTKEGLTEFLAFLGIPAGHFC